MPNLTDEKEAEILEALRAKVASLPNAKNVIADEPLLDSKQDVLKTICVQNTDKKTEVKYIKIDFLGFEDSATDGCEDNPVVYLSYNLHVFQQYVEKRKDNSTSTKDVKKLVIDLRNLFLVTENNARVILPNTETQPLTQNQFIILNDDPLTGAYGHYVDLICKVTVE